MAKITAALEQWLNEGYLRIGEIRLAREGGSYSLCHYKDAGTHGLKPYSEPADAFGIALDDDAGTFRPLKSSPNLRRGWKLVLPTVREVQLALDFLYPAMVGTYLAWLEGRIKPIDFRDTASRQTGMYRAVGTITDEQAQELIATSCASQGKCLKTILWRISPESPARTLPPEKFDPVADQVGLGEKVIPLLCTEVCNLVIAAAREVIKKSHP